MGKRKKNRTILPLLTTQNVVEILDEELDLIGYRDDLLQAARRIVLLSDQDQMNLAAEVASLRGRLDRAKALAESMTQEAVRLGEQVAETLMKNGFDEAREQLNDYRREIAMVTYERNALAEELEQLKADSLPERLNPCCRHCPEDCTSRHQFPCICQRTSKP